MHTHITSGSPFQFWKMQKCVFSHYNRFPERNGFVIEHGREITSGNSNHGVLLKKYLGSGEMYFYHCLRTVISNQYVGDLRRVEIHCPSWINAPIPMSIAPHVLD